MPNAAEARVRLRILLLAPSPLVAADCRGRAVELEETSEFLTTERTDPAMENLSNVAFQGLDIRVSYLKNVHARTHTNTHTLYFMLVCTFSSAVAAAARPKTLNSSLSYGGEA